MSLVTPSNLLSQILIFTQAYNIPYIIILHALLNDLVEQAH